MGTQPAFVCPVKINSSMARLLDSDLSGYVDQVLEYFGVPGATIAVVGRDGSLVQPWGLANQGTEVPATPDTPFAIGDCSKAFTAVATALLVDDGKLQWDDPARKYLPEFSHPDSWVADHVTIRDLLAMRTGHGRRGIIDWGRNPNLARLDIFRRLREIPPACGFRERYSGSDVGYSAVAEIVSRICGVSFDRFLAERLFDPLGLDAAFLKQGSVTGRGDCAVPHADGQDGVQPFELPESWGAEGASCIYLSAADAARWMSFHLNKGRLGRQPLVSRQAMDEIHGPQIIARPDRRRGEQFSDYCMGWMAADLAGRRILYHDGRDMGAVARLTLDPENKIGVFVALNLASAAAISAISYRLLEAFTGDSLTDWAPKFKSWMAEDADRSRLAVLEKFDPEASGTGPAPIDNGAGTYRSPVYGEINLIPDNDGLTMRVAEGSLFDATLRHVKGGIFEAHHLHPGMAGTANRVRIVAGSGQVAFLDHPEMGEFHLT